VASKRTSVQKTSRCERDEYLLMLASIVKLFCTSFSRFGLERPRWDTADTGRIKLAASLTSGRVRYSRYRFTLTSVPQISADRARGVFPACFAITQSRQKQCCRSESYSPSLAFMSALSAAFLPGLRPLLPPSFRSPRDPSCT